MDKKIIAVICASLIVISVAFASCGKKKPTINAKDATYEVVTDEEGNTVLNENGEIEIYVTDEDGKKVTDENGEIKTGAVPFPDQITDGVFHETKYFKMVYPNGWTVGNSGIATSKKYKGLDAQVMYSGAATDDSAAENEANNTVSQWNQILSQAGDAVTGVTTMFTDKGLDTGDMLLKAETPIGSGDTAGTLTERLSHTGAELLIETLRRLEAGDCPREKQDESQSTYDPKVDKEMGRLRFEEGTEKCLLRVRAMCPWPCAFAELAQGALKVWSAAPAKGEPGAPAGKVLSADKRDGLVIATADGAVELCEVQAPNARRMDARAFLLGHPIAEGTMLNEVRL